MKETKRKIGTLARRFLPVSLLPGGGNISQIADIAAMTKGKLDIYSGNDDQITPIMALGGIGVISVLSNIAPRYTHDLAMSYLEGDVQKSCEMQLKALPLVRALFSEVNPIPVKAAMNLMGKEVGPLRMPLTEMEEEHKEALKQAMIDFGLKLA